MLTAGWEERKPMKKNSGKTCSSAFLRVSFSQTPFWSPLPLLLPRVTLSGAPALAWRVSKPQSLEGVHTPVWAGCGPSGLSLPQRGSLSCDPLWHGAPPSKRVSSCVPTQRFLSQVSYTFQGVAIPLQLPLSEMCLSWAAVGTPGCLRTYCYIKSSVGAAEPETNLSVFPWGTWLLQLL